MTDEDRALNELWQLKFGGPMPILGASDIVRMVLGLPAKPPHRADAA